MWRRPLLRLLGRASPPHSRLLSVAAISSPAAVSSPAVSSDLSLSIADALNTISNCPAISLADHFSLHFSDVNFSTSLLSQTLSVLPPKSSPAAAADLFRYLVRYRSLHPSDSALAAVVQYLGHRRDIKSIQSILSDFLPFFGSRSLFAAFSAFSNADRPNHAISVFSSLPTNLFNRENLRSLISSLCEHGFPSRAERACLRFAHQIPPDDDIVVTIISGYSSTNKLDHALRLFAEGQRGGFELQKPAAYNPILDCICRVARKRDPLQMQSEANKLLHEMAAAGVARDAETFRILISNLCKIRRTEDALTLFKGMAEWGCSPDAETYLVLIRSLYQAARVSEGDEMIVFMRSAGFGDRLDRKAYYGFIKILCGIERVEHAVKVFRMMKGYGHAPGVKTYTLLISKLTAHNMPYWADALFKEAVARRVPLEPQVYKVDKKYVKAKKEKKVKKRLTLPEKTRLKRKRLHKLRLSFVRKPKSRMRRYA